MKTFSFEKLDIWKISVDFILELYQVTEDFPDTEKYGLVSQLRRASVSIASNIAEGSSRNSAKDQARFYNIAYSSALEVLNLLIISNRLKILKDNNYKFLRPELERITHMINRLHKATNKTKN